MSMFYELMMRKKGMPSRYQKVEYIESTGTQYIDTGVYLTGDSRVKIKFQLTNTTYKGERIFGSQFPNETFRFGTGGDVTWRVGYWDSTSVSLSTPSPALNVLYEIDFNKTEFYLNNNLIHTFTKKDFTATHTAYLFNVHYTNNTDFVVAKVYSCQIYDNNRLVRNFIPVYDTLTNKYGMWESVQGKFYGNAGTGDFKGSIVGYTVVGSPTITDGVVSGFSNANYLSLTNLPADTQKFEIVVCFESNSTDTPIIATNSLGFIIRQGDNQARVFLASTTSSGWDISNGRRLTALNNAKNWIKIEFTGTQYILSSSNDGINYTIVHTINNSSSIYGLLNSQIRIGQMFLNNQYYNGLIYINETYIKINNKLWFNGQQA